MSARVWFVTGASRGFGRAFASAALERGDRVVATARRPETLDALVAEHGDRAVALRLDVTDRAEVTAAVRAAVDAFGRLDVVVNNAGYGLLGGVEEVFSGAGAGREPGDPDAAADVVREIVDSPEPPLRVLLGNVAVEVADGVYAQRMSEWAAWEARSRAADRAPATVAAS
jgi:NAD(P)-dependent dehydrogenase (short-subunit alcohol dehydrogenase family)